MKSHSLCALGALCGSITASSVLGQSAQIPAPKQSRTIVIENATIHASADEVLPAPSYVIFEDGMIVDVGRGDAPQVADAERMDASGLHLYPGLISTSSTLGLTETGAVGVTHDYQELGDFTPEVRAAIAVNPDTDLIPVTRANGIVLGLIFPSGGTIAGRCSVMRFDGWTWEDMAIDAEAGLVINWPRTEAGGFRWGRRGGGSSSSDLAKRAREKIDELNEYFDEAELYLRAREVNPNIETDLHFEAMRDVIEKRKPVFVRANSASQIESAVAWGVERDLRLIIVGGTEADEAAPLLKKHNVPVIIGGTHRLPGRAHDDYDSPFELPKRLFDAGVKFAIASGAEAAHERNLNHAAATAAAYGLPKEEALRAVTQSAAEILGIADQYGALETGKSATMILTTGDPLEITTDTLVEFIDGRKIDLTSRHTRLYDKYQQKYKQLGLLEDDEEESTSNDQ